MSLLSNKFETKIRNICFGFDLVLFYVYWNVKTPNMQYLSQYIPGLCTVSYYKGFPFSAEDLMVSVVFLFIPPPQIVCMRLHFWADFAHFFSKMIANDHNSRCLLKVRSILYDNIWGKQISETISEFKTWYEFDLYLFIS